jgi:broad specificity phosphatase PhoE
LDYLSNREEKNLAVVTHGFILRIVMAVVVHGEKLTGEECEAFIQTFHHENTGITVLGYDEDKSKWWLWAWNDHAHLSELKD